MPEARWSLHFAWGRAPYALDLPEVVIGRGDHCTLQIEEPTAAEEHARFTIGDDDAVWIESVHADRPTVLNGRNIDARTQLHDGDFIQIGHAVLTLRSTIRRAMQSPPEARTIAGEMPEEVRKLMAGREAKNFVVGQKEPSPLATVMMQSPLALTATDTPDPRAAQRTIQANADDLMAAVRQHATESVREPVPEDLSFAAAESTLVPEATKISHAPPIAHADDSQQHHLQPHDTLRGIGPREMSSAPTMIRSAPSMPSPTTTPMPAVVAGSGPAKLPGESTVIAPRTIPSTGAARPRSFSNPELTPLPAIAQPMASIQVLGPLVNKVLTHSDPLGSLPDDPSDIDQDTDRNPKVDVDVPLGSAPTMLFPAVKDVPQSDDPLHNKKTMAPTRAPLHQQKTGPSSAVPASVVVSGSMPSTTSPTAAKDESDQESGSVTMPKAKIDAPSPTPVAVVAVPDAGPYVAPQKGMFGSFSRAIDFFQQMFAYAKRERTLLAPMYRNLTIATIVSVALSALLFVLRSPGLANVVMLVGLMVLYFIDYQCNALTASLINDYVTTGKADMAVAKARVAKVRSGIMVFAGVSGLLDFATTYARERSDVVGRIMLGIVRSVWTTATYFILPSMVIEGLSFGDALTASKKKMEVDPTGVGAGVVALSLVSYFIGAIVFPLAFTLSRIGSHLHPAFGMVLFYAAVNVYWAVTGWLKISYSTCFYLWARRCEETGTADHAHAPLPLRHALDAG